MVKTKIIKISPTKPDNKKIKDIAKVITNGGLVAFPTETVYGLGANALDKDAVDKIFIAKGRPQDNPLIVHISDLKQLVLLVTNVPETAKILIKKFWPGPLTLIFEKSSIIPNNVTAGLNNVAIRMPSNKIARSLIQEAKVPIAAPSANLFSKPSPTNVSHVIEDLNGIIEVIIDGGKCNVGLESTVLDLTCEKPMILRPGKISLKDLQRLIPNVILDPHLKKPSKNIIPRSPGMKYKHYSPKAKIILVDSKYNKKLKKIIISLIKKYSNKKVAVLTTNKETYPNTKTFYLGKTLEQIAKNLFNSFRECDKEGIEVIIAQSVNEEDIGLAIMNRLRKASSIIIKP